MPQLVPRPSLARPASETGSQHVLKPVLMSIAICLLTAGCSGPVQELIGQLQDPDVEVRRASARALRELGPRASGAASALERALSDPDGEVARQSAMALGNIGADAEPSIPALTGMLDHDVLAIRFSAAMAIQRIDPKNERFRPVLVEAMRTGDGGAIVTVGEMGPEAAWAVATLEELARGRDSDIRFLAVQALGQIGPPAHEAQATLQRATKDHDEGVRDAARQALESVGGVSNAQDK